MTNGFLCHFLKWKVDRRQLPWEPQWVGKLSSLMPWLSCLGGDMMNASCQMILLGNRTSPEGTRIVWRNAFKETAPGYVFGPISPSCIREHGVETLSLPGDIDDFLVEFKNQLHFSIHRIIPLLQMIHFQEYILTHLIAYTQKTLTNSRESAWLIVSPEGP